MHLSAFLGFQSPTCLSSTKVTFSIGNIFTQEILLSAVTNSSGKTGNTYCFNTGLEDRGLNSSVDLCFTPFKYMFYCEREARSQSCM